MTANSETTSKAPRRRWPCPREGIVPLGTFPEPRLGSADHSDVLEVTGDLGDGPEGTATNLPPPTRVDALNVTLADAPIRAGRRSAAAFAAAGTGCRRRVINEMVCEADVLRTAEAAFANAWRYLKLCFMIGLPTAQDASESLQPPERLHPRRDGGPAVIAERASSPGERFDARAVLFGCGTRMRAAPEGGVDVARHPTGGPGEDKALTWDSLNMGLENGRTWKDRSEALVGSELEDCRWTPRYGTRPGLGLQHQAGHLPSYARPG